MNQQRQENLDKLLIEISQIFLDAYENILESEVLNKLLQRIYEECGARINELMVVINLNEKITMNLAFNCSETVSDDKFAKLSPNKAGIPIKFTEEDRKLVSGLKIRLDDGDEREIKDTYLGEANSDTNTPEADSTCGKPVRTDESVERVESATNSTDDTDTRSIEEISASLKTLARKLNLNSRKALADSFNKNDASEWLGVQFPKKMKLGDDTLWLKKIQEVISQVQKSLQSAENIKKLLILFENTMKFALESQKK